MKSLSERDKDIIWHPFTQEKTAAEVIAISRGQGTYLYDEHNNKYLDLISSWWTSVHGHSHPAISSAIYKQACKLDHVIFAGFTHEPAVVLCEELQKILPDNLTRFFFADNGSTAVEVALKMSYQYWHNQGKDRTVFLSFDGGYHGDTFGAMSVSGKSGFHDAYQKLFFKVLYAPYPATWDGDTEIEQKEHEALSAMDKILEYHHNSIAAMIIEPLIQGASGMNIVRPGFIKKTVELLRSYNIFVIFDEVMTGFGRTGTYFATDQIGAYPDFICLSKGITGGFLPLALTVTTNRVYDGFFSENPSHTFLHGHSYSANPISCAAAIESLMLLRSDECTNAIKAINQAHTDGMQNLKSELKYIKHLRTLGTISAFEIERGDYSQKNFIEASHQAGLIIRPLGNIIYLLPNYAITKSELIRAYSLLPDILNA